MIEKIRINCVHSPSDAIDVGKRPNRNAGVMLIATHTEDGSGQLVSIHCNEYDTRRLRDYLDGVIGDRAQTRVDDAAVEARAQKLLDDTRSRISDSLIPLSALPDSSAAAWRRVARTELAAEAKTAPSDDAVLAKAKDMCWDGAPRTSKEHWTIQARAALAPKPPVPETVEEIEAFLTALHRRTTPTVQDRRDAAEQVHSWLTAAKERAP